MTRTIPPLRTRDIYALLLVVLVAAVMRFSNAGTVEFFHDEAMVSMMAQELADGVNFPTIGIVSSVGLPNPPTGIYVMAIPYLFTDNPLIATLFVAGLNVVGVGLLWLIARRYFGAQIALIAGLVYAVNPWALMYSRKIWAQDFHTPLILLGVLLGLLGFIENRRWAQVLCLPVLLFAMQIHFAAWTLLPLYLVLVWHGWRHVSWRVWLMTLLLSMLVLLPYTIGILNTLRETPDLVNRITERTTGADDTGIGITTDALRFTVNLTTGIGVENWMVPQTDSAPTQQNDFLNTLAPLPVLMLTSWLFGVLALIGIFGVWRYFPRWLALLTLVWVFVPLVVFSVTWTMPYPHYFVGALPAYALLIGVGAWTLVELVPSRMTPLFAGTIVVGVLIIQSAWWSGTMRYVDTTPIALGAGTSGYTTPVRVLLDVREIATRESGDVVVVADGQWVHFDVEAARFPVMLRDSAACVRTLPPDGFAVFPDHPFSVVIAPASGTSTAGDTRLNEIYQNPLSVTIPARGENAYTVGSFENAPPFAIPMQSIDPILFDNGVYLTGYAIMDDRVYLEWRLPDAPSREFYESLNYDFQYFVHLLDMDGGITYQMDTSFWAGRHWCAGDRLISWVTFEGLTGADEDDVLTLRTGFYTLSEAGEGTQYLPVDVLDSMGNPAGNWADIVLTVD